MTCNDVVRFIARRADDGGSIDEKTRLALDAHVETCASCHAALETQRVVSSVLRTRPADRLSPAFTARLASRLDDVSGWFGLADWRVWTLRLAPVAIVLALAIVLGAGTSTPSAPQVPASAPVASMTVDEWTIGASESASPASLLWRSDVSPESVMEAMLTGEVPVSGGGTVDVR